MASAEPSSDTPATTMAAPSFGWGFGGVSSAPNVPFNALPGKFNSLALRDFFVEGNLESPRLHSPLFSDTPDRPVSRKALTNRRLN